MNTKKIGDKAESLVSKYLISLGYSLIDRNYRTSFGEIDIIAKNHEFVIFVEVKYRSNQMHGEGYEYVDLVKGRKIIKTSRDWLSKNYSRVENLQPRIDVVSVDANGKITYLENAVESID